MSINFDQIEIGGEYDRNYLAELWRYESSAAIKRGVVTPRNTNKIIFFVTKNKPKGATQYNDYIDHNLLFWEGEEKHSSDARIVNALRNRDEIHLFYRDIHRSAFIYYGIIELREHQINKARPSEFIFEIISNGGALKVHEAIDYYSSEYLRLDKTEQQSLLNSRIGQGAFRSQVIKLWGSCAVTETQNITILRASHIKPWKLSNDNERMSPYNGLLLVPNLDALFDCGLTSFDNSGDILISKHVSPDDVKSLHLSEKMKLKFIHSQSIPYLTYHRENVFLG